MSKYKEINVSIDGLGIISIDQEGYRRIVEGVTKKAAMISLETDPNVYGTSVIELSPQKINFISMATASDIKIREEKYKEVEKKMKAEQKKKEKERQENLKKLEEGARKAEEEKNKKKGLFGRKK